jgi:hypothetical protein
MTRLAVLPQTSTSSRKETKTHTEPQKQPIEPDKPRGRMPVERRGKREVIRNHDINPLPRLVVELNAFADYRGALECPLSRGR